MASHVSPLHTLSLDYGLSLIPRLRFSLSFRRADKSVKAVDEWHLKEAVKSLLRNSVGIGVADSDVVLQKEREPQKKRREEPVAWGTLIVWDIEVLLRQQRRHLNDDLGKNVGEAMNWAKRFVIEKLEAVELNVSGLKVRCEAQAEVQDEFEVVKQSWEDFYPPAKTGHVQRNVNVKPDTLILKAVPSRWFAEPRVSSRASILVTHTIFSKFGMIRNLEVDSFESGNSLSQEEKALYTPLQCQMWVQYETFSSFALAMQSLCGRSMKKEGTSFKANYLLSWDKDGYFLEINVRKRKFEKERLQGIERRQLAYKASKEEIALRNAKLKQVELVKQSTAHISREGYQKQMGKAVSGELQMQEEKVLAVEDILLKGKFQKVGNEQEKQGSELLEQHSEEMAKHVSKRDEQQHFVEVERYAHSGEDLFKKSVEELPKPFQDAEYDADEVFDTPELVDEAERWPLECTTTDASLATCSMLEQAAFKLSMLQSYKGTYGHPKSRRETGYPFQSQDYNTVKLLSKVVQQI